MSPEDPEWLDYQKLAARIYEQLDRQAVVKHDDKIFGHQSKKKRQIDVSIRKNICGHELLVIVQAKCYKDPVDVNEIGELIQVKEDVLASKAICICNAGFTDGAQNMAEANGVDLCTLHDTTNPKWGLSLEIPTIWAEYEPDITLKLEAIPDQSQNEEMTIPRDMGLWQLVDVGTGEISTIAQRVLKVIHESKIYDSGTITAVLHSGRDRIIFSPSYSVPVKDLKVTIRPNKSCWKASVRLGEFLGINNISTKQFTGRLRISGLELPFQRDERWEKIPCVRFEDMNTVFYIEKIPGRPEDIRFIGNPFG